MLHVYDIQYNSTQRYVRVHVHVNTCCMVYCSIHTHTHTQVQVQCRCKSTHFSSRSDILSLPLTNSVQRALFSVLICPSSSSVSCSCLQIEGKVNIDLLYRGNKTNTKPCIATESHQKKRMKGAAQHCSFIEAHFPLMWF